MATRFVLMLLQLIVFYHFLCLTLESCLAKISQAAHNQAEAFDFCGVLLDISPQTGLWWISTQDFDLCKLSYTPYYRYGLDFSLSRPRHVIFWCILLSGNIAINPCPVAIDNSNTYASLLPFSRASLCKSHLSCLQFNARSLKSFTRTIDCLQESNLTNFQNLVYSEDLDVLKGVDI